MIELGGNITLNGFSDIDPQSLVIVKKVVGNYVKQLNRENTEFKGLSLKLEKKDNLFSLTAQILHENKEKEGKAQGENLFFAISEALNSVL